MSLWGGYSDYFNPEMERATGPVAHSGHEEASYDGLRQDGVPVRWPGPAAKLRWRGLRTKRAIDVSLAVLLLAVFAPLACLLAVLIKMSGPGTVLYKHPRIGRSGRIFSCLKFRTMYADADERLRSLLASDASLARQWTVQQKLDQDPRVTHVGRLLRATSLDELPQLINVLRGDMSLVGPRPVTPSELARYGAAAELYLQVRPGLTGVWQVSGRNLISYDSRVQLDRDYITNWRLTTDLRILARTPGAVLSRRGAS